MTVTQSPEMAVPRLALSKPTIPATLPRRLYARTISDSSFDLEINYFQQRSIHD